MALTQCYSHKKHECDYYLSKNKLKYDFSFKKFGYDSHGFEVLKKLRLISDLLNCHRTSCAAVLQAKIIN